MIDKPPHASKHCRHYSYDLEKGGAQCAKGVNLFGSVKACMPDYVGKPCVLREEHTAEEHAAWNEFVRGSLTRLALVISEIPDGKAYWGKTGSFACPACKTGTVRWTRAPNNGHIWAHCSTPNCCKFHQ